MTWVAVAVAGSAVIGAGASYAGAKKQAGAAKNASSQQMQMFNTLNAQQQPFVQSGYGAIGKLNTLLGLGGGGGGMARPSGPMQSPSPAYRPTPGGGVQPIAQVGPQGPPQMPQMPQGMPQGAQQQMPTGWNPRLNQILQLRAMHGDTEAARMLGMQ